MQPRRWGLNLLAIDILAQSTAFISGQVQRAAEDECNLIRLSAPLSLPLAQPPAKHLTLVVLQCICVFWIAGTVVRACPISHSEGKEFTKNGDVERDEPDALSSFSPLLDAHIRAQPMTRMHLRVTVCTSCCRYVLVLVHSRRMAEAERSSRIIHTNIIKFVCTAISIWFYK